ncbi:Guanine-specific ribonuclease N1/T1 [Penicillium chermesinum]|nr:Guanine-specific ribonuclease N1/T1 [Penicillium chermesinum]
MQHTGATVGGAYTACTRVTPSKRDLVNREEVKEERSVQEDETEVSEEIPRSVNDLETRAKKKKIGSATCPDGTTLAKDDVGSAFSELRNSKDYDHGGYPHPFGNQSGGGQVFAGVTKELREYPIVAGETWTCKLSRIRFSTVVLLLNCDTKY